MDDLLNMKFRIEKRNHFAVVVRFFITDNKWQIEVSKLYKIPFSCICVVFPKAGRSIFFFCWKKNIVKIFGATPGIVWVEKALRGSRWSLIIFAYCIVCYESEPVPAAKAFKGKGNRITFRDWMGRLYMLPRLLYMCIYRYIQVYIYIQGTRNLSILMWPARIYIANSNSENNAEINVEKGLGSWGSKKEGKKYARNDNNIYIVNFIVQCVSNLKYNV